MAERSHTHVYSRSALLVWRAVPLCCDAMLAQGMRAQRARHTAARAKYHTLTCPHSSARPSREVGHRAGDADDETSVVRGRVGRACKLREGRFQCVLPGTTTETATMRQELVASRKSWSPRGATRKQPPPPTNLSSVPLLRIYSSHAMILLSGLKITKIGTNKAW